jgi:hypothetical protein
LEVEDQCQLEAMEANVFPATGVGVHAALGDDLTKATGVGGTIDENHRILDEKSGDGVDVDDGHLDASNELHEDPTGGDGVRDLRSGGEQSHEDHGGGDGVRVIPQAGEASNGGGNAADSHEGKPEIIIDDSKDGTEHIIARDDELSKHGQKPAGIKKLIWFLLHVIILMAGMVGLALVLRNVMDIGTKCDTPDIKTFTGGGVRVQVNKEEVALAEHCSKVTGMMHIVIWLDVMGKVFSNSHDPGPSDDLAKNKHLDKVQLINTVVEQLRYERHPGRQQMDMDEYFDVKKLTYNTAIVSGSFTMDNLQCKKDQEMWIRHKFNDINKKELTGDKIVFRWDPGPKNKCLDSEKKFDLGSIDLHTVPEPGEGFMDKQGVWDPGLVLGRHTVEVMNKLVIPAWWMMGLSTILGWGYTTLMAQDMLGLNTHSKEMLSAFCDSLVIMSFEPQSGILKHEEYTVNHLRKFEPFRPVRPFSITAGGDLGTKFSNLKQEQDDKTAHQQVLVPVKTQDSSDQQVQAQKRQQILVHKWEIHHQQQQVAAQDEGDSAQSERVRSSLLGAQERDGLLVAQLQDSLQGAHVRDSLQGEHVRARQLDGSVGQQVQAEIQHHVQDDRDDQQWRHSEQEDVTYIGTQILFHGEIDDKVFESVDRQKDVSDSVGLKFVKMDTATREIQHLDTGQMRDELSTLGKVLYKTPDRKLLEQQQLMAAMKMEYDEAAMEMKYDEAAMEMKYYEIITTGDNVFKTRIEMVEQHMADMRMKYDEAITMRNMEMRNSAEDKDYVSELPQHTEKPKAFSWRGKGHH